MTNTNDQPAESLESLETTAACYPEPVTTKSLPAALAFHVPCLLVSRARRPLHLGTAWIGCGDLAGDPGRRDLSCRSDGFRDSPQPQE